MMCVFYLVMHQLFGLYIYFVLYIFFGLHCTTHDDHTRTFLKLLLVFSKTIDLNCEANFKFYHKFYYPKILIFTELIIAISEYEKMREGGDFILNNNNFLQ